MKKGLIQATPKSLVSITAIVLQHRITFNYFFTEQKKVCALQKHHCFYIAASRQNENLYNQNFTEGNLDP
jgi:hypothetical protein